MTETLEKEIKRLMWKLYWNKKQYRLCWSAQKWLNKGRYSLYDIFKKYKMSDEFLRHHIGSMWGSEVGSIYYQDLTEDFMREFSLSLDWMCISIMQKLSESFMTEMGDYIKWNHAAENQVMSEQFILDNAHRLNYYCLVKNRVGVKLSERCIYELSKRIDKNLFNEVFIKEGRITEDNLEKIRDRNQYNRFEVMDI